LAAWSSALNETGYWAYVLDASWRYVFITDELRLAWGEPAASMPAPIGCHYFSEVAVRHRAAVVGGSNARPEGRRPRFVDVGPYVLSNTPGGRDELRRAVDPELVDLVDELEPRSVSPMWVRRGDAFTMGGGDVGSSTLWFRVDDDQGNFAGCCLLIKPAV